MDFEGAKRIRMHLEIAPLIDIVFLLLIFFMLTANFIVQPAIKIKLPAAETGRPEEKQEIILFITGDNKIFLDGSGLVIGELKNALRNKMEKAERKTVILKADEKISLGLAVNVIDIARDAGAQTVAVSTAISENFPEACTDFVSGISRLDK